MQSPNAESADVEWTDSRLKYVVRGFGFGDRRGPHLGVAGAAFQRQGTTSAGKLLVINQALLGTDKFVNRAALARHLGVSRTKVTQVLRHLAVESNC